MPSRRDWRPIEMRRMAVVAPETRWRRVLVEVADAGCFETDPPLDQGTNPLRTLVEGRPDAADAVAELAERPEDPEQLLADGELGLLLGEAELADRSAAALPAGSCHVLPGWLAATDVDPLRSRLADLGGALVELPGRAGLIPPTAHPAGGATAWRPLVSTYAAVPYRDIDPTLFAAATYLVMFGMMFGDVGHGLAILAVGLAAWRWPRGRLARLRPVMPFLVGAGLAATVGGLLYGEAFGPTGLVPTLWLRPLEEPGRLLAAGLVVGGVLLALTLVLSTVDRWREGGPALAVYDPSGIPGALLLAAVAAGTLAAIGSWSAGWPVAVLLGGAGVALTGVGLVVRAGVAEAAVELFDTLLRLGSNLVSFSRLAAFGLTHAVLTTVVWDGTVALWQRGGVVPVGGALVLLVVGNLAAFALGALVAAIQALRLEYYELFSRLFTSYGRPFTPWHLPVRRTETP